MQCTHGRRGCLKVARPGFRTCEVCAELNRRDGQARDPEAKRASGRKAWTKLRDKVLASYGNTCSGCGHTDTRVLDLDHVNDDGADQRRGKFNNADAYRDAIARGFPADYQLLCRNCNWLKQLAQVARINAFQAKKGA